MQLSVANYELRGMAKQLIDLEAELNNNNVSKENEKKIKALEDDKSQMHEDLSAAERGPTMN